MDKFIKFIKSLKTTDNKSLIESIYGGYQAIFEELEWEPDDEEKRELDKLSIEAKKDMDEIKKNRAPDEDPNDLENKMEDELPNFINWLKKQKKGFQPEIVGIRVYMNSQPSTKGTLSGNYSIRSNAKWYKIDLDEPLPLPGSMKDEQLPGEGMTRIELPARSIISEETGELLFKEMNNE